MKQLFNGITFGIGFAVGNRIVDYYKDKVDLCIQYTENYILTTLKKK